jgi:hypothetical protein
LISLIGRKVFSIIFCVVTKAIRKVGVCSDESSAGRFEPNARSVAVPGRNHRIAV